MRHEHCSSLQWCDIFAHVALPVGLLPQPTLGKISWVATAFKIKNRRNTKEESNTPTMLALNLHSLGERDLSIRLKSGQSAAKELLK